MKSILHRISIALSGLALLASVSFAHGDDFTPAYVDSLVPGYLALQKALAGDDLPAAKSAATQLNVVAKKGPKFEDLTGYVAEIANAADLKAARAAFAEVSSEMITVIDHVGTSGGTALFSVHCPMAFGGKGGDWIQGDKDVRNPYYGAMMLTCGSVQGQVAGEAHAMGGDMKMKHGDGEMMHHSDGEMGGAGKKHDEHQH